MNLPPHCRIRGPSVYYVRKVGGKVPWIRLGRIAEGEAAIWTAYRELLSPSPRTVADIVRAWISDSHDLKPRTQREYARQLEGVIIPVFGNMRPDAVTNSHIARFLETRGGVRANREIAALSTVFEWARRKGWADHNPCRGVRRNRERPRSRYIRILEWKAALRKSPPALREIMQAAYLTGLRQGDLRALRIEQIGEDGITVEEGKRGKRLIIRWSPPLKRLVNRATSRSRCDRVFTNSRGQPWTLWGLQSAFRRIGADFTFHDIRARAESDHPEGLGLMVRYKRAKEVDPVR